MKCPNCSGQITIDKDNFYACPYCGQKFGAAPNIEQEKKAEQQKLKGIIFASLSVVFLFFALMVFGGVETQAFLFLILTVVMLIASLITGIISVKRFRKKLGIVGIVCSVAFLLYIGVVYAYGFFTGLHDTLAKYESPYLLYETDSLQHPENFNAPDGKLCREALDKIDGIIDVAAVTEYHDPNGGLAKEDGYTACFYYSYQGIDLNDIDGYDLIDKGNVAGGTIEIYRNEADAKKRLDTFADVRDHGVGGLGMIGSVVFRTSPLLDSSDQQKLFEKIVQAMDAE